MKKSRKFHLEGVHTDGDPIPEALNTHYELVYKWDVKSLLHYYKGIIPLSYLEKLTGINQTQLGHYAAGRSKPRRQQAQKTEKALHQLGDELKAISL